MDVMMPLFDYIEVSPFRESWFFGLSGSLSIAENLGTARHGDSTDSLQYLPWLGYSQ